MSQTSLINVSTLFLIAFIAVGCAAGNRASITAPADFALEYRGSGTVAVAVHDQRHYVLSDERKETRFGHQRSLYGIPFPTNTASGRPLATELADMIVNGLKAKGVTAISVRVSPHKRLDDAVPALVTTGSNRLLLFTITKWNADTYSQTTLSYDIKLSVFDNHGVILGQSSSAGNDSLTAGARPERRSIPAATADILQTLLSTKEIVAALSPDAIPVKDTTPVSSATPNSKCTVDQIIKMRESGISRQQINAACS